MLEWIQKYHDGYVVIGWGSLIAQDSFVLNDECVLLRWGVEPNNIKEKVMSNIIGKTNGVIMPTRNENMRGKPERKHKEEEVEKIKKKPKSKSKMKPKSKNKYK